MINDPRGESGHSPEASQLSGTQGYAFILVIMRMMYMVGWMDGFITLDNLGRLQLKKSAITKAHHMGRYIVPGEWYNNNNIKTTILRQKSHHNNWGYGRG